MPIPFSMTPYNRERALCVFCLAFALRFYRINEDVRLGSWSCGCAVRFLVWKRYTDGYENEKGGNDRCYHRFYISVYAWMMDGMDVTFNCFR
jgi:hypothetical protein